MSTSLKLQQQPKAPPYSLEAEQSVLGGLMLENRHWDDLADKLGADDFYREDHQMIYRAIAELARSEEHTSELQSLMSISCAVFCLKKKKNIKSPAKHNTQSYHEQNQK